MEDRVCISYSSSNDYAKYAYISLKSLFQNNADIENIDIYYIAYNLSYDNKKLLKDLSIEYGRNLYFIEFSDVITKYDLKFTYHAGTFAKLFLAELTDVEKMIYIDCDTLVLGPIKKLWDVDLECYALGAVIDNISKFERDKIEIDKSKNNKIVPYVNAGNIILNLSFWRNHNLTQKCVDYIKKKKGDINMADQGIINTVLSQYIKIIEPIFNAMPPMYVYNARQIIKKYRLDNYYSDSQIVEVKNTPIIVHFTEDYYSRPWNTCSTHPLRDEYVRYMKDTTFKNELTTVPYIKKQKILHFIHDNLPFTIELLVCRLIEIIKKIVGK